MNKLNIVRFAPKNGEGFYDTLKKNIDDFFKENNIPQTGNRSLWIKTVAMLILFFVRPERLELSTARFVVQYSIQLSYERI